MHLKPFVLAHVWILTRAFDMVAAVACCTCIRVWFRGFRGYGEVVRSCSQILSARVRTKRRPSMLGVGLLIPNFCAEIPLFKSFATILTLTRDSFLYAETHLLGITRISGCFFVNASTSACPMTFPAPHFSKFPISSSVSAQTPWVLGNLILTQGANIHLG